MSTNAVSMTRVLFPALFVFLSIGCSGNVRFGGKVAFEDDGTPLSTGTVIFTTATFQAEGRLQEDGSYQLGSLRESDGLPPGNYAVFIKGAKEMAGESDRLIIGSEFSSREKTPLRCEVVRGGAKRFDFQVSRPEK